MDNFSTEECKRVGNLTALDVVIFCFSHPGNIILTGRGRQYTLNVLRTFLSDGAMIPNRIVRYFMFLGYTLGHGGCTSFPTFKNGVTQFYFEYLHQQYYLKQPAYYPRNYGVN